MEGVLSTARWDLDECDRRGTWWLERPQRDQLPPEPIKMLEEQGHGTAVIWEELDRLDPAAYEQAVVDAADHLALAFHRFLAGEIVGSFSILLNDRSLPVIDPFLQGHSRGQAIHPEVIVIDGQVITISPFVLPYPSRLKPGDLELVGEEKASRRRMDSISTVVVALSCLVAGTGSFL